MRLVYKLKCSECGWIGTDRDITYRSCNYCELAKCQGIALCNNLCPICKQYLKLQDCIDIIKEV